MAIEIERKFLVQSEFKSKAKKKTRITQGYLSTHPKRTVRVRISGNKSFITIKGEANESGTSRYEWEKEIALSDANELLKICETQIIDKTRFLVEVKNHTFEVDEFHGENEGLIIAEIELNSENEDFEKPNWLGQEVTGDAKYYNAMLIKDPYKNWKYSP